MDQSITRSPDYPITRLLMRASPYGSLNVAQAHARCPLPEHPPQRDVRDVRSRSRRVHVLRSVRLDGVLVRRDPARVRPRRRAGAARLLLGRARLL